MSIRESIANMQPGDPPLIVERRQEVNYLRVLAKENGHKLRQKRQSTGEWEVYCIGFYKDATLVWLRRIRSHREMMRKWRSKNHYYKRKI